MQDAGMQAAHILCKDPGLAPAHINGSCVNTCCSSRLPSPGHLLTVLGLSALWYSFSSFSPGHELCRLWLPMRVASQVTAHQSLFFPWDLATEMPVKEALLTTDTTLPTLFLYPLMLSQPDLFCVNLVTLCLSKLGEDSYFLVI